MVKPPESFIRKQGNPAEVFAPGVFIAEEIKERGWTPGILAKKSGMGIALTKEIIKGHRRITTLAAFCLSDAFDISYQFFLNMQKAWDERDSK